MRGSIVNVGHDTVTIEYSSAIGILESVSVPLRSIKQSSDAIVGAEVEFELFTTCAVSKVSRNTGSSLRTPSLRPASHELQAYIRSSQLEALIGIAVTDFLMQLRQLHFADPYWYSVGLEASALVDQCAKEIEGKLLPHGTLPASYKQLFASIDLPLDDRSLDNLLELTAKEHSGDWGAKEVGSILTLILPFLRRVEAVLLENRPIALVPETKVAHESNGTTKSEPKPRVVKQEQTRGIKQEQTKPVASPAKTQPLPTDKASTPAKPLTPSKPSEITKPSTPTKKPETPKLSHTPVSAEPSTSKDTSVKSRPADMSSLSKEMLTLYHDIAAGTAGDEAKRTQRCLHFVQKICEREYPGAVVAAFGSSMNGFMLKNRGDLDLCMVMPEGSQIDKAVILRSIGRAFRRVKFDNVVELRNARIPIIKCLDSKNQMKIDITFGNTLALENTKLLQHYASVDVRFQQLGVCIKYWAKRRSINDASKGTLSSYGWLLLTVFFLQTREIPVLPCLQKVPEDMPKVMKDSHDCTYIKNVSEVFSNFGSKNRSTVAQLFYEFLQFYHTFDFDRSVISIRTASLLDRKEKGWLATPARPRFMSIEDPFDISDDIGKVLTQNGFLDIKEEIEIAIRKIEKGEGCESLFALYVSKTE